MHTNNQYTDYYIASPFFSKDQINSIRDIEDGLDAVRKNYHSPRKSGAILDKNASVEVRRVQAKAIFQSNISEMDKADQMIAIVDTFDIGTLFEVGYFIGSFISDENGGQKIRSISEKLTLHNPSDKFLKSFKSILATKIKPKNGGKEYDTKITTNDIPFVATLDTVHFLCIDDRPADIFMLMGVLYACNIPFYTYSVQGYGSNVMIAAASVGHYQLQAETDILPIIEQHKNDPLAVYSTICQVNDIQITKFVE